jgi:hypothetical protein
MSQYWPAALFLIQGLLAWFLWSMRRSFVSKEDFDDHRAERAAASQQIWDRVNEHHRDLAVMQERVINIPDHREFSGLRDQVGAVQGDVKSVVAGLSGLREAQATQLAAINRIQDYLLRAEKL